MLSAKDIKHTAAEIGFDLCGIAPCRRLEETERRFRDWLAAGRQADLHYLERNLDKRFDPRRLVEGAQSVAVCAVNYKNAFSLGYADEWPAKIASYALNRDYHRTLKEMLRTLLLRLRERYPALQGRAFTDSAGSVASPCSSRRSSAASSCWARWSSPNRATATTNPSPNPAAAVAGPVWSIVRQGPYAGSARSMPAAVSRAIPSRMPPVSLPAVCTAGSSAATAARAVVRTTSAHRWHRTPPSARRSIRWHLTASGGCA